ncbi:MAG TPA: phosphatase PAP2 family protein [Ilumatobacteraceae bacterium]|nr:phosphatase PAP2 family protein [Ilumatobacteraceae bacterium]
MKWPTWSQALLAATIAGLIAVAFRRSRPTRIGDRIGHVVGPAALEFAFVASLYAIWRMAKNLPLTQADGAIERARDIVRVQEFFQLPSELTLQSFTLEHEWLAQFSAAFYAVAHVPGIVIFLVWLYARHREVYPHWRDALAIVTAFCLFIRFVKVAPPRYLPDLGYVDVSAIYNMSVYGEAGTGVSSQFAAMPSLHVAWAAVVAFGALSASTSKWRWIGMAHLVITMLVVSATGHHWWLDGIVALVLLWIALRLDTIGRQLVTSLRSASVPIVVPSLESVESVEVSNDGAP